MKARLWVLILPVAVVLGYLLLPLFSDVGAPGEPVRMWHRFSTGQSSLPHPARPPNSPETYYWTTPGIEPDTGVAAWLLTRFVTPGARVEIAEQSKTGIPFDLPGCDLQRRPGKSASDVVLQTYGVTDALAVAVVKVIHELELNPWTTKDDPFFVEVRGGLAEAVNASDSDAVCLERMLAFLDRLGEPSSELDP